MAKTAYATPVDDQASWRQADHTHPLPAHLVAFLQGGVSVTLCARSASGRPVIGDGVACRVRDMTELRVLLSQGMNLPLVEAVRNGSALAATFTRANDHRSIQLKTLHACIGTTAPDDHGEAARQSAILAEELMELGYPRPQAEAYAGCHAADLISLVFRPERVFTQTPGPGAGAELER